MADKKISALTAASTPLAGSEVLPIVQSGSTVKVSIDNLTTGKTVQMNQINLNNSTVGFPTLGTASGSFRMLGSGGGGFGLFGGLDGGTGRAWLQAMRTDGAVAYDLRLQPVGGSVRVGAGDVIIETAGKGIDFSANGGDVLGQYDEGTWTPVVTGSTSAGTANYDFRIARYTRIGRMVQFEVAMQWNSGTGTGNLRIDGLPFTNAANYTSVAIGRIEDVALSASHVATAFVEANATYINIWQCPTGGGTSLAVPYDAAGLLFIAGSYSV